MTLVLLRQFRHVTMYRVRDSENDSGFYTAGGNVNQAFSIYNNLGLRMIIWRSLPAWLFRAWPVLALLPIIALHAWALSAFDEKSILVNKLVGMSLQVVGGLLILYSIDQNLGLFTKQSLIKTLIGWIREFPIARKTVILCGTGSASGSSSSSAAISTRKTPTTLEERVADLELRLHELQVNTQNQIVAVHTLIDTTSKELSGRIEETTGKVRELSRQLYDVSVGGFKLQAFGVLLAVYGALASVYS